ncbi:hypothetical protein AAG570_012026 [Ranatra chinensis]|uniref:Peptidase A1 domain-containing protein n=1 Tax=Ranatra chinensis TaxID=642074 RepID=A0ABD0YHK7_9HEMI
MFHKNKTQETTETGGHSGFDGSKSKTYKDQNINVLLPDSSQGNLAADVVTVGSAVLGSQVFVELWHPKNRHPNTDGVFGLGIPYVYEEKLPPPPFYKVLSTAEDQLITLYFGKDKSEIAFGGIDYSLVKTETIAFAPITVHDCWTIEIERITVSGKDICPEGCQAMLDTAAEGIMAPGGQVLAVRELTRHAKTDGFFSCSKLAQLPSIKFYIGGKVFELEAKDYAVKVGYNT